MNFSSERRGELFALLHALRDARLSTEQSQQLRTILAQDDEALRLYINHATLIARLHWAHSAATADKSLATSIDGNTGVRLFLPRFALRIPSWSAWAASLLLVGYFVAMVGLLAWERFRRADDHEQIAARPSTTAAALLTYADDASWKASAESTAEQESVPQTLHVRSGLAELKFARGASVIVEGPAEFEVCSPNSGFLRRGKLTAMVPKPAIGFVIETPTAKIVDLGTEFGVEVTEDQQSRLHVFEGKVVVRANRSARSTATEPRGIELSEGETVSVDAQGVTQRYPRAEAHAAESASRFVRKISKKVIRVFSLVDVVAGGDGFGTARDRGIDPTTGKTSATQANIERIGLIGDGGYHPVEKLPFVDGVFVPHGNNPVQLDSAGHTFAGFPSTDNNTFGHIWSGGVIPQHSVDGVNQGTIPASLEGVDYSASWHSLLSVHANKGITFDLQAIRRANPTGKILRFVAIAGNAAAIPRASDATKWCDVWVFVDGEPRFSRERIEAQKEFKIAVDLDDHSRFLSLVATDGGDGFGWDHVIFVDPCLVLQQGPSITEKGK